MDFCAPDEFLPTSFEKPPEEDSEDEGEESSEGRKFLKLAEKGRVEKMEMMLSKSVDLLTFRDSDGYTALHRAAYSEQVQVVEFLVSRGADISLKTYDGWTPLHSACRWNSSNCTTLLLQKGASVNAKTNGGLTPLHVASENAIAREVLIILLLHTGLDEDLENPSGETAEKVAGQHGSYKYLFELVRKSLVRI